VLGVFGGVWLKLITNVQGGLFMFFDV
jgi:hypothetical protein